ncbi:MAG: NUDIX hydrolase [Pseudonocardia sp.]|nr:NUDIX hydrolase [Pseudonocardia sp.]
MSTPRADAPDTPVVPRPAATVLLVRDDPDPPAGRTPLQVFLQRRVAGMAFAGGMTVFPGGGVSSTDTVDPVRWRGPDPVWWGRRLETTPELGGSLVCAAVRETFEECGVLLAGPDGGDPAPLPEARALRTDLVERRSTLGDLLAAHDLVLRADLLRGWARWITPPSNPRRYDTAFLVARVPDSQRADDGTSEALEARWWSPSHALACYADREIELMAPTLRTLQEIAEHDTADAVFAAAEHREITPVIPRVRREGRSVTVVLPNDPEWEYAADHLTPKGPDE